MPHSGQKITIFFAGRNIEPAYSCCGSGGAARLARDHAHPLSCFSCGVENNHDWKESGSSAFCFGAVGDKLGDIAENFTLCKATTLTLRCLDLDSGDHVLKGPLPIAASEVAVNCGAEQDNVRNGLETAPKRLMLALIQRTEMLGDRVFDPLFDIHANLRARRTGLPQDMVNHRLIVEFRSKDRTTFGNDVRPRAKHQGNDI